MLDVVPSADMSHRPLGAIAAASAGETPNEITFTTLINACGRSGQLERAYAAKLGVLLLPGRPA